VYVFYRTLAGKRHSNGKKKNTFLPGSGLFCGQAASSLHFAAPRLLGIRVHAGTFSIAAEL
jgi:hypothetical protein